VPRPTAAWLGTLALLFALPFTACAQPSGLVLRWNQCAADGGIKNRVFACNTNVGSERLVCSYETGTTIAQVSGAEITVDIRAASTSLPLWWQFRNTGTCRVSSLALNFTADPNAVNCVDQWSGQASGGIGAYQIGLLAPNMARIRAAGAVPQAALFQVDPGIEYFVCNVTVNHQKTVGAGACSGCVTPVCVLFASLVITTPVAADNRTFTTPRDGNSDHWVGWQGAVAQSPHVVCDQDGCNYQFGCSASPVATRGSTWGALKSLYR
jgi:hypothetical protein